ncbi:MAG: helix-turn-helix domain-containing protein, partial [Oscillospiraceae bacterium]
IAYPRHIAMYIAYEVLDVSYSKLGDEFNRDHSSVMSAIKKIKAKLSDNSELSEIITELVQNIKKN